MTSVTYIRLKPKIFCLKTTNSDKYHTFLIHVFPSETSILSQCSFLILFLIYRDIHLKKLVDNSCYFREK